MAYFKLVRDSSDNKLIRDTATQKAIVYPDTWTVSFSGIDVSCAAVCQTITILLPFNQTSYELDLGGFDPNDTFTLTRDDPSLEPCTWRYTTGVIGTFYTWSGPFCGPFPTSTTPVAFEVQLRKFGSTWELAIGTAPITGGSIFFDQIPDSGICCGPLSFSNDNTSGGSAGHCCEPALCFGKSGAGVVTA